MIRFDSSSTYDFTYLAVSFMCTWYGLQLAHLHPYIKDVFKKGTKSIDQTFMKSKTSNRKNVKKTRFIKKHFITVQDVNLESIYQKRGLEFNRKTLVWPVRGHWRRYKNGKNPTWINIYEKGPDRNIGVLNIKETIVDGYGEPVSDI